MNGTSNQEEFMAKGKTQTEETVTNDSLQEKIEKLNEKNKKKIDKDMDQKIYDQEHTTAAKIRTGVSITIVSTTFVLAGWKLFDLTKKLLKK